MENDESTTAQSVHVCGTKLNQNMKLVTWQASACLLEELPDSHVFTLPNVSCTAMLFYALIATILQIGPGLCKAHGRHGNCPEVGLSLHPHACWQRPD